MTCRCDYCSYSNTYILHPHWRCKLGDKAWEGGLLKDDNDSPSYGVYNPKIKSVHLGRNVKFDEKDFVTRHLAQEEHDEKQGIESFFTSRVTPAATRSRPRGEEDNINSTEEPTSTPPKQTLLAQTPPIP